MTSYRVAAQQDESLQSESRFRRELERLVDEFPRNRTCRKLDEGRFTMDDYHGFLRMTAHQVASSSVTFEAAGRNMAQERAGLQSYLFGHAEEERDHWRWVLSDLESTGYGGPNPLDEFPPAACAGYVAWNHWCASKGPVWRLANASYLESLGAKYGKRYAQRICQILDLGPDQASFLFGHGDTDIGHSAEILDHLSAADLTQREWDEAAHAVRVNAHLYFRMYEDMAR